MDDQLTHLEQMFVNEYLRSGDGALAVVRSGIRNGSGPDKIAEELLSQPHIRLAIEGADPQDHAIVKLTKDSVKEDIYSIKDKAVREGRYSEALGALKLISDLEGFRSVKVEVEHKRSVKDMTDDELLEVLDKLERKRLT